MTTRIAAKRFGSFHGALQIIRFNWPWFGLAIIWTAISPFILLSRQWSDPVLFLLITSVCLTDFWMLSSVIVSHCVYDLSKIASGSWVKGILPVECSKISNFHAGLDESSGKIRLHYPTAHLDTFDFHDRAAMNEPSIERARQIQKEPVSIPVPFRKFPDDLREVDAAFVVFAAHELRQPADLLAFFNQLHACLATNGHLILVEHLRDAWNFLAFGPGVFHFLPRSQWVRTFSNSRFVIQKEFSITPFVTVFHLRRGA